MKIKAMRGANPRVSLREVAGRGAAELEMAFLGPTAAFQSPDRDVSLCKTQESKGEAPVWQHKGAQSGTKPPSHSSTPSTDNCSPEEDIQNHGTQQEEPGLSRMGHSRRSQVYPRKAKPAAAMGVLMQTLRWKHPAHSEPQGAVTA